MYLMNPFDDNLFVFPNLSSSFPCLKVAKADQISSSSYPHMIAHIPRHSIYRYIYTTKMEQITDGRNR